MFPGTEHRRNCVAGTQNGKNDKITHDGVRTANMGVTTRFKMLSGSQDDGEHKCKEVF